MAIQRKHGQRTRRAGLDCHALKGSQWQGKVKGLAPSSRFFLSEDYGVGYFEVEGQE